MILKFLVLAEREGLATVYPWSLLCILHPRHLYFLYIVPYPALRGRHALQIRYPADLSNQRVLIKLPMPHISLNTFWCLMKYGGEGGIRTLGTRKRTTVFETAPFDHSGTSPYHDSTQLMHKAESCTIENQ